MDTRSIPARTGVTRAVSRFPMASRWSSIRPALPWILLIGVFVVTVVGIVGSLYVVRGTGPMHYLDDAAVVLQGSPFAGSVSVLGNFLWVVAGTACLIAVSVVPKQADRRRSLLLAVGIGSLLLCIDDQFMIHDALLQQSLGLGELWLTAPIAVVALAMVIKLRTAILDHADGAILLLGVGLLALSLGIDAIKPPIPGRPTLEEIVKLAGIAFWCLFSVRAATGLIREAPLRRRPGNENP